MLSFQNKQVLRNTIYVKYVFILAIPWCIETTAESDAINRYISIELCSPDVWHMLNCFGKHPTFILTQVVATAEVYQWLMWILAFVTAMAPKLPRASGSIVVLMQQWEISQRSSEDTASMISNINSCYGLTSVSADLLLFSSIQCPNKISTFQCICYSSHHWKTAGLDCRCWQLSYTLVTCSIL